MDFGSTTHRRGKSVVLWARKEGFLRSPNGDTLHPASNLNLTGFLGGVLCVPDSGYGTFLEEYVKSLEAGDRQFLTECNGGGAYRAYFDLDYPGTLGDAEHETIARALYKSARLFLPDEAARADDATARGAAATLPDCFRCVLCTAPSDEEGGGGGNDAEEEGDAGGGGGGGGGDKAPPPPPKSGVHLVMPGLVVDRERALDLRNTFVAHLREAFPGTTTEFWLQVCDASVYNDATSGLRMVGSNKMRSCKVCFNHSERRRKCADCVFTGKVDVGRPYSVRAVYDGDVRNECLTDKMRKSLHLAVRYSSIRTAAADRGPTALHPAWTRFQGCPSVPVAVQSRNESRAIASFYQAREGSAAAASSSTEASSEFKDDKKGTSLFHNRRAVPKHDRRIATMLAALPRIHANYGQLECYEAFQLPDQEAYFLKVRGKGQNFCLNKARGDHRQATVYFYFSPENEGSFHQRCFSRKETTQGRIDGWCRCWRSEAKRLGRQEFKTLWPHLNLAEWKHGAPARVVAAATTTKGSKRPKVG